MFMRMFARSVKPTFGERLAKSSSDAYKNLTKGMKNPPPYISGPITDKQMSKNLRSPFKPATQKEMAENYEQLEASRRNGPSW